MLYRHLRKKPCAYGYIRTPKLFFKDAVDQALYNYMAHPNTRYAQATGNTTKHEAKRNRLALSFVAHLMGPHRHFLPAELLELVPSDQPGSPPTPFFIKYVGGTKDLRKKRLVSDALFEWITNLPVERGESEFHQPRTSVGYIRTLLGHYNDEMD